MSYGADIAKGINDFINEHFLGEGEHVQSIVGEVIASLIMFIGFIIAGWIVYHVFEHYFTRWAKKTKTNLDDEILKNIKKPIYFFVIIVGAFYSIEFLSFLKDYQDFLRVVFILLEIFLVAFIITRVVNVLVAWYAEKRAKKNKKMSEHILFLLKKLINLFIYIIAFLVVLAVLKVDLTGAFVGLGVAGIAIGFALQNVLGDIFSAFTIYFDKPYEIGDYIVIGSQSGIVKKIGIQSTRLQTLQGEELVVSNNDMISTRIQNFKKMKKRRINFSIGVTYNTSLKKLKKVNEIIKSIIDPERDSNIFKLDRVHFKSFGDFSLNFEIVYYLKTADYVKYLNTQQEINFLLKEAFEKEGIEMAFPTQTVFLNK